MPCGLPKDEKITCMILLNLMKNFNIDLDLAFTSLALPRRYDTFITKY